LSCEPKMIDHWDFLRGFINELIEMGIIEYADDPNMAHIYLEMIEYGFKLAWPHAWKHGEQNAKMRAMQ